VILDLSCREEIMRDDSSCQGSAQVSDAAGVGAGAGGAAGPRADTGRASGPPAEARPAAGLRADARRNRARILAAAAEVFAEHGASASTEEIARRAGVAIGTVFRHFPTKDDLLRAIMKDLLEQLTSQASLLAAEGDPAAALPEFFASVVAQAAGKKTVVDLLAAAGTDVGVAAAIQGLQQRIGTLLSRAQQAGAVRQDVQATELMALITSTCHGALHGGWDDRLQHRVLTIIFDGLRPAGTGQ
jgi:AcrR family transcriptional regulator